MGRSDMTSDGIGWVSSNTPAFEEIVSIIDRSRERMFRSVNRELIDMYWEIGRSISEKVKKYEWGLIGSLCDLVSGSGDKGTPIILIHNYFKNYSDDIDKKSKYFI